LICALISIKAFLCSPVKFSSTDLRGFPLTSTVCSCGAATPLRNQIGLLCGGKRDETTFELVYRAAVNDVWHGLGGSTDACTVGCRCNPTDGDWLHIGQRLSGNGSECTTRVWAGWHQAREQLGHRWSQS